ncbi:hypothetical protein [Pseudomonas sp. 44 R 15]|uniref:hypothetical protein n=1 Tax=Pseudomonas sp. 44 R 15 TaxID=1844105 RepID=UPI0008125DBA|nr:hypothetical protein [Pseudomonas sp. 44 R 15]CRM63232.1 hypothetical protein [Pseudomonas sp. 44 R 15]
MQEGKGSLLKNAYRACTNPEIWIVNICALLIGAWYWNGFDYENPNLIKAVVTIIALIFMGAISLLIFLRDDGELRWYQRSKNLGSKLLLYKEIKDLQDTPVKDFLYAHYSLTKYKNATGLAVVWSLLWAAVLLTTPKYDGIEKSYLIPGIPIMFLGASVLVLIVTGAFLYVFKQKTKKNWFSLSKNPPTNKYIPKGFEPEVVLCKSPAPLLNWGTQDKYRCKISEINGNKMPKGKKRDEIEWSYIPLEK